MAANTAMAFPELAQWQTELICFELAHVVQFNDGRAPLANVSALVSPLASSILKAAGLRVADFIKRASDNFEVINKANKVFVQFVGDDAVLSAPVLPLGVEVEPLLASYLNGSMATTESRREALVAELVRRINEETSGSKLVAQLGSQLHLGCRMVLKELNMSLPEMLRSDETFSINATRVSVSEPVKIERRLSTASTADSCQSFGEVRQCPVSVVRTLLFNVDSAALASMLVASSPVVYEE